MSHESPVVDGLPELRIKIDRIDEQLFALMAERMALVKDIGKLKKTAHMDVIDPTRELEMIQTLTAKFLGRLSAKHVESLARTILAISHEAQNDLLK